MLRSSLTTLVLAASMLACASTPSVGTGTTSDATATSSVPTKSIANAPLLSREEIMNANLATAYDLVDRLRRPWLRRDSRTGNAVQVVVDNEKAGVEVLRNVPSADLEELRYVGSVEAIRRWPNLAVDGPIILVVRRR